MSELLLLPKKLTPLETKLEGNPLLVYLAGLAPTGRRSMAAKLKTIAAILGQEDPRLVDWAKLRFEHVSALRSQLETNKYSPATINNFLSAIKGVMKAAWHLSLITAEEYQKILAVKSVNGHKLPSGRALSKKEISALLAYCAEEDTILGIRDGALIALLLGAGLRRSECISLDLLDYDRENSSIKIKGKGNKERLVYLVDKATTLLDEWIELRGSEDGHLLTPVYKGGHIKIQRLTDQAIYNVLVKRAKQASIKKFSPHDLRRTFVSELLDAGADIVAVQHLVGHSNINTTARYDRRGEKAKRKAIKLVNLF
jgi:site-specific recombinase XerD